MHEFLPSEVDISVVLPVFNERGDLDDGSIDGSGERLREIEDIRLIQSQTNRGSGSARKLGTLQAQGRVVVWTDVDMTYSNDKIPRFIKELDSGRDYVVGAPRRRRTGRAAHPQLVIPFLR